MRSNEPLLWTQAGLGIPPAPRPPASASRVSRAAPSRVWRRRDQASRTPPAAARPPQRDGPPHPRPPEPLQAGTRPTSPRPAGPGGFRFARGPTPPPRPESSHSGLRASRVPEEAAAPGPARPPAGGPTLTHPPAGRTPPAPSLRFPSVQLY